MKPEDRPVETILSLAIQLKNYTGTEIDYEEPVVFTGHTYDEIKQQIMVLTANFWSEVGDYELGYITTRNRFLTTMKARSWGELFPYEPEVRQLQPENILCAANYLKEYNGGVVVGGWRHHNIIIQIYLLTGKMLDEVGQYEDGFITTKNRFVNRTEGAEIFKANGGQLSYSSTLLFSEDVY